MTPEQQALLTLDYERTATFLEGTVSTLNQIRGWAVTVTLAVLAIAFSQNSWVVALLVLLVAGLFAVLDLYQSWLYREALEHAHQLEEIWQRYTTWLSNQNDPDAVLDLAEVVEAHGYGVFTGLNKAFGWHEATRARFTALFGLLYAGLALAGVAAALVIGYTGERPSSRPCDDQLTRAAELRCFVL